MIMVRVFYSQSENLSSDVLLPAIEAPYYGLRFSLGFCSQNTCKPDADTFDHRPQVHMFETATSLLACDNTDHSPLSEAYFHTCMTPSSQLHNH